MANPGKHKKSRSQNNTVLDAPQVKVPEENIAQNLLNMGIGVISVIIMALVVIAMIQFVG